MKYPRKTSFVGTVNDERYLIDETGNRRFATIPIKPGISLDYDTQIAPFDSLQFWAQIYSIVQAEDDAVDKALNEMPDDFLIKPFLMANKAEVKHMCITEYDESRTLAEQRAEGRAEGVLNTLVTLVKKGLITITDAANTANMTVAEFEAKTGLKP